MNAENVPHIHLFSLPDGQTKPHVVGWLQVEQQSIHDKI